MISQEKFIASVKGKKVKIQEKFVKILRYFNKLMPYTFKVNNSFITDYVYVTICRSTDFDMVLASVYTLYKNSKYVLVRLLSFQMVHGKFQKVMLFLINIISMLRQ